MCDARLLTEEKTGTVIAAGEQSAGRGRLGRYWNAEKGESLLFTVILRYGDFKSIPHCLTLRAGLAASLAIEDVIKDFAAACHLSPHKMETPHFSGKVMVKWPNDIMLLDRAGQGRKAAGILAENENGNVYLGIGVNVAQKQFPPDLYDKACSIGQIILANIFYDVIKTGQQQALFFKQLSDMRFNILERALFRLHEDLANNTEGLSRGNVFAWREELEKRLYMKGQRVRFFPGEPKELSARPASAVEGVLQGIGDGGEIVILQDSGELCSFTNGELAKTPAFHSE